MIANLTPTVLSRNHCGSGQRPLLASGAKSFLVIPLPSCSFHHLDASPKSLTRHAWTITGELEGGLRLSPSHTSASSTYQHFKFPFRRLHNTHMFERGSKLLKPILVLCVLVPASFSQDFGIPSGWRVGTTLSRYGWLDDPTTDRNLLQISLVSIENLSLSP